MLKHKIQEDLKNSMLNREELKTSVLRMLKSALSYFEINKGGAGYEATDDDVLTVIEKEAKQRRDSIEQYTAGGRQDLAAKESKELEVLLKYLPEQMSEDQITKIIDDVMLNSGFSNMQDMGKIMGLLMPRIKGKADGMLVSKLVKKRLQ